MNLPPALTWLQLFPRGAACAPPAEGPQWFAQMLAKHAAAGSSPRVLPAWGKSWHELADLPKWDGFAGVNCGDVTVKRLEAAGFAYARRFAVLPSLEHARWFIPLDGGGAVASAGFSVYTPARFSAHLKKAAARLAARLRLPIWYRDSIVVASRDVPPLEKLLAELLPDKRLRLALSAGAPEPAINRKASGAVLGEGGDVLAFVKIAGSPVSRRIQEHEAQMLPALGERGRLGAAVPRLLYGGEVDGRFLTVQTPLPGKPAPTRMTPAHLRFLESLRSGATKMAAATHMVAHLSDRIAALPPSTLDLAGALESFLPTLENFSVPSTIVHGDFAPWNLRLHRGEISAFDWEYGELDGLPLIDQTHFTLQLGFQLQQWDVDRATHCLAEMAQSRPMGLEPEQVRAIHAVYLLDNLARLLGEGYPGDDEMVSWYGRLLARLEAPKREAALV